MSETLTDDPGALLHRVIDAQWPTIARQAWQQYQQRGRGAVVFTFCTPGTQDKEPLRYLTFRGDSQEIAQSAMATLHELVASYNPREEAVVAIVLPDERTVFDVFARSPKPAATTK